MVIVQVARGVQPFQLEDFPKDAKRSVEKGALHFRPGTKVITDDEWTRLQALIEKERKDLTNKIVVVSKSPDKKASKAKEKPEVAPALESDEKSDGKKGDKKK
jgi:hypothetical protein